MDGESDACGQVGMMSTGSYDSCQGPSELKQMLLDALSRMATAVNNFLFMYTRAFRVDFTVEKMPFDSSEGL